MKDKNNESTDDDYIDPRFTYDYLELWLTGKIDGTMYTDDYGVSSIYIDGNEVYMDKEMRNAYHDMFENLTEEQKKIGMSFHKKDECDFCNGNSGSYASSGRNYSINTFLTMNGDFILSFIPDSDDIDIDKDYVKFSYNYCPMCGKKLDKIK